MIWHRVFFRELVQALPSNDVHRDATLSQTFSEQKSEAREKYCSTKLSDRRGPKVLGDTNYRGRRIMRILIMTAILGLPLMALGQTAEPQQTQAQGQTKETQATAPAKGKKMRPAQEPNKPQTKPETGTDVRGQTNVQGRAQDVNRNETG